MRDFYCPTSRIIPNDYILIDSLITLIGKEKLLEHILLISNYENSARKNDFFYVDTLFCTALGVLPLFWQNNLNHDNFLLDNTYPHFPYLILLGEGLGELLESFEKNFYNLNHHKSILISHFLSSRGYFIAKSNPFYDDSLDAIHF